MTAPTLAQLLQNAYQTVQIHISGDTGTSSSISLYVNESTDVNLSSLITEIEGQLSPSLPITVQNAYNTLLTVINKYQAQQNIGDLSTLSTTEHGSLVGAVNELDSDIGSLGTLTTTAKSSLVSAVNELDSDIGVLSSLSTTAQGSLVAAVNELSAQLPDTNYFTTTGYSHSFYTCSLNGSTVTPAGPSLYTTTNTLSSFIVADNACASYVYQSLGADLYGSFDGTNCSGLLDAGTFMAMCMLGKNYQALA